MSTPTPPPGGYRLIRLQVENVKKVRYVDITPEGNLVVIAGANGQGKSSILDSIMWGLGGGRTFTDVERPIRDGAKKGTIKINLENARTGGSYTVVRTFTAKGSPLSVEDENGPVRDQQAVLSALIGEHSFDPFQFMRLPKRDQRATLLNVVDLDVDLDALATKRETAYNDRTMVGRTRDRLEAQLAAMPTPIQGIPADEVPMRDVLEELNEARTRQEAARTARAEAINLEGDLEDAVARIAAIEERMAAIELELSQLSAERLDQNTSRGLLVDDVARAHAEAKAREDWVPDIAAIEQRMSTLDATNRQVRAAKEREVLATDYANAKDEYDADTRAIDAIDEQKVAALQRATMPIEGLTFDDDGLYYSPPGSDKPVPIGQCADSEQLRISVAIAVALNPHLRMARVKEGSLLDSKSLGLLRDLADEHNFQIWLEMVAEVAGGDDWLMIDDGQVVDELLPQFETALDGEDPQP